MKYQLTKPITIGPRVFTEVMLREPDTGALLKFHATPFADDFSRAMAGLALLTGMDAELLERLAPRDFVQIGNGAAEIFARIGD